MNDVCEKRGELIGGCRYRVQVNVWQPWKAAVWGVFWIRKGKGSQATGRFNRNAYAKVGEPPVGYKGGKKLEKKQER